jgi:hypothetical protein
MYFQLFTGGCVRTLLTPLCRVPTPKAPTYRTPVLKWILCVQTCNLYGLSVRRGDEELLAVVEGRRFRSNERGFVTRAMFQVAKIVLQWDWRSFVTERH